MSELVVGWAGVPGGMVDRNLKKANRAAEGVPAGAGSSSARGPLPLVGRCDQRERSGRSRTTCLARKQRAGAGSPGSERILPVWVRGTIQAQSRGSADKKRPHWPGSPCQGRRIGCRDLEVKPPGTAAARNPNGLAVSTGDVAWSHE